MKYALGLLTLACGVLYLAFLSTGLVARLALLNTALCLAVVAAAYATQYPGIFTKRPDGRVHAASWLLFWPYYAVCWISWAAYSAPGFERPFHEAAKGILLGRRLGIAESRRIAGANVVAVLDVTSEFAEVPFMRNGPAYLCIPVLDGWAPTLAQLNEGVEWMLAHCRRGNVYVHCALGHGRSATFVAAYLLKRGIARDPEEAVAMLKSRRPLVRVRKEQMEAIRQFCGNMNDNGRT